MSTTIINTLPYSKKVTDMILYVVAKQLADSIMGSSRLSEKPHHPKQNRKKKIKDLQRA